MAALQWIERTVPVADLKPYERNPRFISKEQFAHLKRSLVEDGYHTRIKATADLRVIGGHMRIKALQEIGMAEVQVLVPDQDISDEQFRRILIRDNINYGAYDMDILSADFEIEELTDWGMSEEQLGAFKPNAGEGLTDPDEVPVAPENPVTVLGDVWLLGAYYECEACKKGYDYDIGKAMMECPCGL